MAMMPEDRWPPKSIGTRSTGRCSTAARTRSRGFIVGSRLRRGRGWEREDPAFEAGGVDVVEATVELVHDDRAVRVLRLAADLEADRPGPRPVGGVRPLRGVGSPAPPP